jgi:hypothetical protein
LPLFVEIVRDLDVKITMCPQCQKPCEPNAASCSNPGCGGINGPYIINPRIAYEIQAIGEDHVALERLTRDTVKEMGISDYVAETIEEKKMRLQVGGAKPVSLAAMRLMDAKDQVEAMKRREDLLALVEAFKQAPKPESPAEDADEGQTGGRSKKAK